MGSLIVTDAPYYCMLLTKETEFVGYIGILYYIKIVLK